MSIHKKEVKGIFLNQPSSKKSQSIRKCIVFYRECLQIYRMCCQIGNLRHQKGISLCPLLPDTTKPMSHTASFSYTISLAILALSVCSISAAGVHDLWLIPSPSNAVHVSCASHSATLEIAREELQEGWQGRKGATVVLKITQDPLIKDDGFRLDPEGVSAHTELGLLYGVYDLLRRQQTGQKLRGSYPILRINYGYSIIGITSTGRWNAGTPDAPSSGEEPAIW